MNTDKLPKKLLIFPLPGALLLPRGHLPLNIFEPRYLNMVEDALATPRLIGMIQTIDAAGASNLAHVGCAGRIIKFEETRDGRFEILLRGICRFNVAEELPCHTPYRQIKPSWNAYQQDLAPSPTAAAEQVMQFKDCLSGYLVQQNLEIEQSIIDKLSTEDLVNSLVNYLPLDNSTKQMLLEAQDLTARLKCFCAFLNADQTPPIQH